MTSTSSSIAPRAVTVGGLRWRMQTIDGRGAANLLPLVLATDPSGAEALLWREQAAGWLAGRTRGIVAGQCAAGMTLLLFLFALRGMAPSRDCEIHRLRWLELARGHRSLDAALAMIADTAALLDCRTARILPPACVEWQARRALAMRATVAGFVADESGWLLPIGRLDDSRPRR